jgi:hypothetical protein
MSPEQKKSAEEIGKEVETRALYHGSLAGPHIRDLVAAAIQAERAQADELRERLDVKHAINLKLAEEFVELRDKLGRAVEALKFYADDKKDFSGPEVVRKAVMDWDRGNRARQTLKEISE